MHRIVCVVTFSSILAASFARADIANDPNAPPMTPNPGNIRIVPRKVWEWCLDWYAPDYYGCSPKTDPANHDYGDKKYRICRGGSWGFYPTHCRSANRGGDTPTGRFYSCGFRVVLAHSID